MNKDDFVSVDDIQDAVGSILLELTDGQSDDKLINDLCTKFFHILKP